jgi:hypothetical protein
MLSECGYSSRWLLGRCGGVLSFRYRSADADEAKLSKSIPFQLQKLFAELQVCVFVCVRSDAKADWYWKCEG